MSELRPGIHGNPDQSHAQVIELPSGAGNQLNVADLLMEVSIMERYARDGAVCPLLDFGVTPGGFRLLMPRFRCTLAEWRVRLPTDVAAVAPLQRLFLNVFRLVRAATPVLYRSCLLRCNDLQ
jgi:hypothetical protein